MTGREVSKPIKRVGTLPTASDTYGAIVSFDFNQPQDTFTIEVSHLTDAQIDVYITTIATIGSILSVTDDKGKEWVGELVGFSIATIKGTELSTMRLTMQSQTITDN